MLWACAQPWLLGPGIQLLRRATGSWWGRPLNAIMRRLVFPHYCAGENLGDCHRVANALQCVGGVELVVDHSQEEREAPEDWARNLGAKINLLHSLRQEMGGRARFMPFKATSVMSPALLERMAALIMQDEHWCTEIVDPTLGLRKDELLLLQEAEANLSALCSAAQNCGIALWLDAEQSHRQPAIDWLARRLMQCFNIPGRPPIIFNTYQLYLVGADLRVMRDLQHGEDQGYCFAAKCVRGAYLIAEEQRAVECGTSSPMHASKSATDAAFDRTVAAVLERIASGCDASLAICTHNTVSAAAAVDQMAELGIPRDSPRVHFAQILGMCDHLTGSLGASGYRAHKLVLFGLYEEVFPWLLRRLDENRDMLGACQTERPLLRRELRRRLFAV